jgi:hypothetical protein
MEVKKFRHAGIEPSLHGKYDIMFSKIVWLLDNMLRLSLQECCMMKMVGIIEWELLIMIILFEG